MDLPSEYFSGDADVEENEGTDVVTLNVDKRGSWTTPSQIEDYALRGQELENAPFLHFVVDTYDERISPSGLHSLAEAEDEGEDVDRIFRVPGRSAAHRCGYLPDHPKHGKHVRVIRDQGHNYLPEVVGPYFPRRDDPERMDYYFASMLALLKPWRDLKNVKTPEDSWEQSFHRFMGAGSGSNWAIMANIQYYYDSKLSAEETRDEKDLAHLNEDEDVDEGIETSSAV